MTRRANTSRGTLVPLSSANRRSSYCTKLNRVEPMFARRLTSRFDSQYNRPCSEEIVVQIHNFPAHYRHSTRILFSSRVLACRVLILLILVSPSIGVAQLLNVADDTSTPVPDAGHDYIHMLSETVNPANGAVSIRIQLPTPPGRGINVPFAITYDSGKVHHFASPQVGLGGLTGDFSASSGGWGDTLPVLSHFTWQISIPTTTGAASGQYCYYSTGYLFQDFAGTQHPLGLAVVSPNTASEGDASRQSCTVIAQVTRSRYGASEIALGGDAQVTASFPASACGNAGTGLLCPYANPPVTVTDISGNTFIFKNVANLLSLQSGSTAYYWPDVIEDRNGNEIQIAVSAEYRATVTDTLNNPVVLAGPSEAGNYSNLPTSYTVGGLVYGITYTTTAANYTVPTLESSTLPATDAPCNVSGFAVSEGAGRAAPQTVISSITLPNNQKYQFYYGNDNPNSQYNNPYGLISEIDYPDGGWVRYIWKLSDDYAELATFDAPLQGDEPTSPNGGSDPNACNYQYKIPVVATRTVGYESGSSAAQTQTFSSYKTTWNSSNLGWTTKTTTVATKDNILNKTAQIIYTYVDCNCSAPTAPDLPYAVASQLPVEQTVKYYDWGNSNAPILTKTEAWIDISHMNCEIYTTAASQSTGHFYSYSYGVVSDDKQYDYGQIQPSSCVGRSSTAPTRPIPVREVTTTAHALTYSVGAKFDAPYHAVM